MPRFVPSPELLNSPRGRPLVGRTRLPPYTGRAHPEHAPILIIGAGIAGVSLAVQLWHAKLFGATTIVDPYPQPLRRFFSRVESLEQRVLRSPYEHHIGAEGARDCEMLDYARLNWRALTPSEREQIRLAQSGQRSVVPLDVFEAYSQHVLVTHQVHAACYQGVVSAVHYCGSHFVVIVGDTEITANNVIWAVGERTRPLPAAWLHDSSAAAHITQWDSAPDFNVDHGTVIGSGLSAAQLISSLRARGANVAWISRTAERFQCADVDARYFRPEGRAHFHSQDAAGRLGVVERERRPSIMYEFQPLLESWEKEGSLTVYRNRQISDLTYGTDGLTISTDSGDQLVTQRLYSALGLEISFDPPLLGASIRTVGQYPILEDHSLEISGVPGAFVIGALATFALGPAARNIDGARVGASRIVRQLMSRVGC